MLKNKKYILSLTLLALSISVSMMTGNIDQASAQSGVDSAIEGLNTTANSAQLITSPDGSPDARQDVNAIISRIIQVVLSITGTLFLILIFVAGQLWMNAGGNEDQVTKARQILSAAVIGLAITIGAYSIANFIIDRLLYVTLGS